MERLEIVILPYGHVVVGFVSRDGEGLLIRDCSTLRQWGTTKGLGQLALQGPQHDTQLDYEGIARVPHALSVVRTIECDAAVWKGYPRRG